MCSLKITESFLYLRISDSFDQRAFQCKLRMQRCSLPEKCQWEVTGPLMKVHVLGKLISVYLVICMTEKKYNFLQHKF